MARHPPMLRLLRRRRLILLLILVEAAAAWWETGIEGGVLAPVALGLEALREAHR